MNIDSWLYYPVKQQSNKLSRFNGVYAASRIDNKKKPVMIYYHGNACSSEQCLGLARDLSNNYIIPEYPGYCGTPVCDDGTTVGIINDVHRLANWIQKNKVKVHIVGQSIGTGPACILADILPHNLVCSLQLITPFTTLAALINDYTWFGGYLVPEYYYDNMARLGRITGRCPLNIYHGTDDRVIPVSHALTLREALGEGYTKTYILEGLVHNDIITPYVFGIMRAFLD